MRPSIDRPRGPAAIQSGHGTKADGTPVTDEMVEAIADEAGRGDGVGEVLRRRAGRRLPRQGVGSDTRVFRRSSPL